MLQDGKGWEGVGQGQQMGGDGKGGKEEGKEGESDREGGGREEGRKERADEERTLNPKPSTLTLNRAHGGGKRGEVFEGHGRRFDQPKRPFCRLHKPTQTFHSALHLCKTPTHACMRAVYRVCDLHFLYRSRCVFCAFCMYLGLGLDGPYSGSLCSIIEYE
jgi:hypothetical protein